MSKIPQKFILIPIERYKRMNDALTNKESPTSERVEVEGNEDKTNEPQRQISVLTDLDEKEDDKELSIERIIEHFPKRIKTKAHLIGSYIKTGTRPINWNKKGELLERGNPIVGSSIQDLLYDAACPRRKYTPNSARYFYRRLKENGTPEGMILNVNRRNYMKIIPKTSERNMKWVKY